MFKTITHIELVKKIKMTKYSTAVVNHKDESFNTY